MKKLLKIIIVMALLVGVSMAVGPGYLYVTRWAEASFCDRPVKYFVNKIDPRFNISREQVVSDTKNSANIWNKLIGKDLFVYDENSNLDINLVFDDRQKAINEISQDLKVVDKQREGLSSEIEEFERRKQALADDLNNLNDEIEYWNNRGGAPKDKYQELIRRQQQLQQEVSAVNQMAEKLNTTADQVNQQIESVNQNVEKFNQLLSFKPEEGIYYTGPHQIDIFIYEDSASFQHTVAHELGHALGLSHIEQPGALMYPVSSPDSGPTKADEDLIQNFCSEQDRFDLIENDLRNLVFIIYSKLSLYLEK